MKALGMYIFAGSMSIAVKEAGFEIDRILEISDEMPEQNAKHFANNYPDIPIVKLSEWNNTIYKNQLFKEQYDLVYGNPPCSGLSQINRHASVDSNANKHMYNFIDMVAYIQPKAFLMENAPTLVSKGKPILDYLVSILGNDYYIIVLRDYAMNHRVPMKRQRTMVFGFSMNHHLGVPQLKYEENRVDASEVLQAYNLSGDYTKVLNAEFVPERTCKDLEKYYNLAKPGKSIMHSLASLLESEIKALDLSEKRIHQILDYKHKELFGKRIFDKSPNKINLTGPAPSLTSVTELIHPIYDRPLFIREYAKLMTYPDSFEFKDNAKVPYVQAIAQGVPVNFAKWAALNIYDILEGNANFQFRMQDLKEDTIMFVNACNYDNIVEKYYTKDSFQQTDNICN